MFVNHWPSAVVEQTAERETVGDIWWWLLATTGATNVSLLGTNRLHISCAAETVFLGDNDHKPRSSSFSPLSRAASPQLTLYLANARLGSPVPVANKSQTDPPPPLSPDEIVSLERGKWKKSVAMSIKGKDSNRKDAAIGKRDWVNKKTVKGDWIGELKLSQIYRCHLKKKTASLLTSSVKFFSQHLFLSFERWYDERDTIKVATNKSACDDYYRSESGP